MILRSMAVLTCSVTLSAASPLLSFVSVEPGFAEAADEYRRIWETEGERIVAVLEAQSGLEFPATPIEIVVHRGPPMTSYDGRSIRMRAGYSPDYKRATFVHEMGHRLTLGLPRTTELDDHRILYLFLYDAWGELYGREFADRMVKVERRISSLYDYEAAWSWALSMTREQRRERLRTIRAMPAREAQARGAPLGELPQVRFEEAVSGP